MKYNMVAMLRGPSGNLIHAPLKDLEMKTNLVIESDRISGALERFVPILKTFESKLMQGIEIVGFKMELADEMENEGRETDQDRGHGGRAPDQHDQNAPPQG